LAAGIRPDPLGELTALPRTPSCTKGGEGREMGMKERWKGKESQEAKRKERSREREGNFESWSMCPVLSQCVIGNHIDLPPPLKMSWPSVGLPTQKS